MNRNWTTTTTVYFLGLVQLAAQTATPREPLVPANASQKVSEHVYVIPDGNTPAVPNVGIIVGATAALVVDTGMGERNGRTVMAEVNKVAANHALYLVTTHVHPEHDLGAQAFPVTTKMIRSADEEKDIAEFGYQLAQVFSSRSAINAELLKGAEFRKADIHFDKEYKLDLGGVNVRILAMGPNHTRGDTATFVETDRVLFSGDVAMKGQPAFASPYSSVSQWLSSLEVLTALQPRVVVPSHGPMGDSSFMSNYKTYLTTIQNRASALKKDGKSVDEATQIITGEMQTQYPDAGRLRGAIRAAYSEAK